MSRRITDTIVVGACVLAIGVVGAILALQWFGPAHADGRIGTAVSATKPIVVGPRGVIQRHAVPHCRFEDGSGGPRPCTWNIGNRPDGNGHGLAYWVGKLGHVHYVWPQRPLGEPVANRPQLVDALVEGERQHWARCWLDENHTHVACPDGYIVRVYGQR